MIRRIAAIMIVVCSACAASTPRQGMKPQSWFQTVRVLTSADHGRCSSLGSVSTTFEASKATPPIPANAYRTVRRAAFEMFENAVVGRGGNAVWIEDFSENGSAPLDAGTFE